MKSCIIIPVYNHEQAIVQVISRLKKFGIPCLLVNDGSSAACSQVLEDLARQESGWLTLVNRANNGGKGAAVIDGFNAAQQLGYTHALQIDADGQHNTDDIPRFLEAGRLNPDAMILGQPVFDESAPKIRLYGRRITNLSDSNKYLVPGDSRRDVRLSLVSARRRRQVNRHDTASADAWIMILISSCAYTGRASKPSIYQQPYTTLVMACHISGYGRIMS